MQDDARNKERSQYEYSPTGPVPPHKKLNVEPPGMPVRQISLASSGVNQRPEWCQVLAEVTSDGSTNCVSL